MGDDPGAAFMAISTRSISIHVPRVGDDRVVQAMMAAIDAFLSTSPAWGTTQAQAGQFGRFDISIHVPRVGDDHFLQIVQGHFHISIHVPRVGDDAVPRRSGGFLQYFYPRPPRGGRPICYDAFYQMLTISIHVPRVGDD